MAEKLGQKLTKRNETAPGQDGPDGGRNLAQNAKVNAKIDNYIKEHPDFMPGYVQTLPRERLERIAVLYEVTKLEMKAERAESRQRIQAAAERKLDKWLAEHPAAAAKIQETLSKLDPAEQQSVRTSLIYAAMKNEPKEGLKAGAGQPGQRV